MGTDESPAAQPQHKLEVGHVLFMDLVGYSQLLIEDQHRTIEELKDAVSELAEFRSASQANRLIRLPTGDGMALVFFGDPEAPFRASVELSRALRDRPSLRLRMGIHSGPVYRVEDINANMNVAGGGVNVAQRVMDCGDAGHILVSEDSARFFAQVGEWAGRLHDVGRTRVKHRVRLHLYSLFVSEVGNPRLPAKLRREKRRRWTLAAALSGGLALGIASFVWVAVRRVPKPTPLYEQLTTNSASRPLTAAGISPDGRYLAYVDPRGIFVRDVKTGDEERLTPPSGAIFPSPDWTLAWLPDATGLLVSGPEGQSRFDNLWLLHPFVGPSPHRIAEKAWFPSVAPDGARIAFIDDDTQRTIWTVGPNGGDPTRVLEAPPDHWFESICWSPTSRRIAFIESGLKAASDRIGTVDGTGSQTNVLTGVNLTAGPQDEFSGLTWLADGRIVFVRPGAKVTVGSNLWAITVDPKSGRPRGKPAQVTQQLGVYQSDLSSTSDGARLAFVRTALHYDVYLGTLSRSQGLFREVSPLVSEDSNSWGSGWTSDSDYILFYSDRAGGTDNIYRQPVSGGSPEPLAIGGMARSSAEALAGASSLLYWSWDKSQGDYPKTSALVELQIPSAVTTTLLTNKPITSMFRCAQKAAVCVVSDESSSGLRFSRLDIAGRKEERLTSMRLQLSDGYDWDLSRDGKSVAVVHSDASDNAVRILSLGEGPTREIHVPGWGELDDVRWEPDGRGLYLAANLPNASAVLHVDLDGETDVLWRSRSAYAVDLPIPSPDGRYVAFTVGVQGKTNAWTIRQF